LGLVVAVRIWVWIRGVAVGLLGGVLLGFIAAVSRDRLGAGDLEFWLEDAGGPGSLPPSSWGQ
jgi:hypothetical protein